MNEYTFLVQSVRDAISAGESQRSLAKLAGVSHATISKLLSGKSEDVSLKTYRTLLDAAQGVVGRNAMQPKTLDATVEQLAAGRVNADLTRHADWDVDLQCAKYRRVMQLEKELEQTKTEVEVWRDKAGQARKNAYALQNRLSDSVDVLTQREQHLKSCENALIEAHTQRDDLRTQLSDAEDKLEYMKRLAGEDGQKIRERDSTILDLDARMDNAKAEIKRLTALSETHGQSWKAACVQVEQLQKQLDHGQAQFKSLHDAYNQQIDDEAEMLAQIDTLFAERDNMRTNYEQKLMGIRTYTWAMFAALAFVVASGLVVWGGV